MVIIAILMSFLMILLDRLAVSTGLSEVFSYILPNEAEGARSVLSTIAGSMITVAGVVFSITIVTLTLASTQFGPRLIINFVHDRGNQIVLGTFISTFVYCLLILRTIRTGESHTFVPNISVSFGVLLALGSISVLIYFIHHVAESMQASRIISKVKVNLTSTIERLLPRSEVVTDHSTKNLWRPLQPIPHDFTDHCVEALSNNGGYIQVLDHYGLEILATKHDLIIKILNKPGDFVITGYPIALVYPEENCDEKLISSINSYYITGDKRTNEQDIEFAIDQLVEIAVRSLSPGINDPFTAITCIDQLGAILSRLKSRAFAHTYIYDEDNRIRLIRKNAGFSDIMDAAFNQIRQNSGSVVSVTIRLLETLNMLSI